MSRLRPGSVGRMDPPVSSGGDTQTSRYPSGAPLYEKQKDVWDAAAIVCAQRCENAIWRPACVGTPPSLRSGPGVGHQIKIHVIPRSKRGMTR
jgi:hypothetical protein